MRAKNSRERHTHTETERDKCKERNFIKPLCIPISNSHGVLYFTDATKVRTPETAQMNIWE